MKILIACETSGVVREAFRKNGHDAYSCDILPSDDASDKHYQVDIREQLYKPWDMIVAFPPCTDLAVSGARWFKEKQKDGRQEKSIDFFRLFTTLECKKVAIENPIGIMSTLYQKPDQIIQPWQFGHGETKATCIWLKGLPKLIATEVVTGREQRIWKLPPSKDRWKERSKTYQGIGDAMGSQWSE
tara:strand:+ start:851 stop:1408 length:558 start_codon:yes stop_codon:yes gene_type:complete